MRLQAHLAERAGEGSARGGFDQKIVWDRARKRQNLGLGQRGLRHFFKLFTENLA